MVNHNKYILSIGTHYISNSGSDEAKAYHGGKAGDQSGHEWELKPWYNRPWSVILRHPDQAVALTIAKLSIEAALNDKIGYDQYQRETYWQALQAAGYDPSAITTPCEEDCTAGVSANVRAAGHLCGIAALQSIAICSSRNMRQEFVKAGFEALTASRFLNGPDYLLPGDVLLYENHHAAANITCGAKVRNTWTPDESGIEPYVPEITVELPAIVIAGDSVNIRKGPSVNYGKLGVVHKGTMLRYFGFSNADGWHLVEYGDQTGWVSGKYGKLVK